MPRVVALERIDVQPDERLGLDAATSSMSTPPCVVKMKSGFFALRSNAIER